MRTLTANELLGVKHLSHWKQHVPNQNAKWVRSDGLKVELEVSFHETVSSQLEQVDNQNPMKQFPPLTDFQITQTMIAHGGSFVSKLGMLFRLADDSNQLVLKNAFTEYWAKYAKITKRCPECGCTDILDRHHDGLTSGVPECSFNECEKCQHQWGHQ